jgi:radical SAM superfamily enzyme YgiQ (UPF0313 family)
VKVLLISTYELGRQPFGLASPAAWLKERGHEVRCADLAIDTLPSLAVREAQLVAFYLPMHTATRLAVQAIAKTRALNPQAHVCAYGLYAPLNEEYLRSIGVQTVLGGEFEPGLVSLVERLSRGLAQQTEPVLAMERLMFLPPDRTTLPVLPRYSRLHVNGDTRVSGYTEASRGCKHLCRHCPVVPVYQGHFRIVQPEIVLADIRAQVAAGAQHITFGDPDFLNGPSHARRIVEAFQANFPAVTYDITAKIEHLLARPSMLDLLRRTGCVFVTTAVESVEDAVLEKLEKRHTRADFVRAVQLCREADLTLAPTFIPFTPWTTCAGYRDLLGCVAELQLVDNVAPVQLALRLLITSGSRLLELEDVRHVIGAFDKEALVYRWKHPDPQVDALAARVLALVTAEQRNGTPRREVFARIWEIAHGRPAPENYELLPRTVIPYMDEPWFC